MSAAWIEAERAYDRERWETAKSRADENCRICRGKGFTKGYIAPSKHSQYECPCTGLAAWQAPAVVSSRPSTRSETTS